MKIGSLRSTAKRIKIGIPQGPYLGPLLFKKLINDLFFTKRSSRICSFADDNTIYSCGKDLKEIFANLEIDLSTVDCLKWFAENGMVANPQKF